MIRTGSLLATFLLTGPAMLAIAQTQAPTPPAGAAPTPSAQRPVDRNDLRTHIYVMEGALMRAVSAGAQQLNREIRSVVPNMMMLSGEPQARGVYLDGYGVYFDVGVPILHQSMVWSLGPMLQQEDRELQSIRDLSRDLRAEVSRLPANQRAAMEAIIMRLEQEAGRRTNAADSITRAPGPGPALLGTDVATGTQQVTGRGLPQTGQPAPSAAAPGVQAAPAPGSIIARKDLQDPNAVNRAYTHSVQNALIDAMIDYSLPMRLGPEEWLTVGARDNMQRDSLAPPDPYEEVVTILLRIKAADLAAYRAAQIDKDEVRRRVQIREF